MKNKVILSKLMKTHNIQRLGLKEESVSDILETYESILLDHLLENGILDIGVVVEVVPLVERIHVLKGVAYNANRKYKLKLTMDDTTYKKVEAYYNKLKEDIL